MEHFEYWEHLQISIWVHREGKVAFVSRPVFIKNIEFFVFSGEYQGWGCHSELLFVCRTLEKPPKKPPNRHHKPCYMLLTAAELKETWGSVVFQIRNPQDRVSSKTWATRSCWFGCCNYFVIFATSQGFPLLCRMCLRVVCWGFGSFCLFACCCGGFCLGFFSLLL